MQGPEGGFYSSTDADSEGEEGRFFTWTADEVRAALPADDAALRRSACAASTARPTSSTAAACCGRTVTLAELARESGRCRGRARRGGSRAPVPGCSRRARTGCRRPSTTSASPAGTAWRSGRWPGSARRSRSRSYLAAAQRAASFLLGEMVRADGRIERSWRDGRTSGAETLEDVAWVAAGLVELYQADGDTAWLAAALRLVDARAAALRRRAADARSRRPTTARC